MERIKVECPSCGATVFKTASEPQGYQDFIGATCSSCGRTISEHDVEEQAKAIFSARIDKLFKGGGA